MSSIDRQEYAHVVGYFNINIRHQPLFLKELIELLQSGLRKTERRSDIHILAMRDDKPKIKSNKWDVSHNSSGIEANYSVILKSADAVDDLHRLVPEDDEAKFSRISATENLQIRTNNAYDALWNINIESGQAYPNFHSDCTCIVTVNACVFKENDYKYSSTHFLDNISKMLIDRNSYYIIQDSSTFSDDCAGECYLSFGPCNYSSLKFRIEHELWEKAGVARREKVRGVFPGQYLSPFHLEKIGGKERLIKDLQRIRPDRLDYYLTDLGEKGVILRLTPTPIDATRRGPNIGFSETGVWAYKMFREAGLLL